MDWSAFRNILLSPATWGSIGVAALAGVWWFKLTPTHSNLTIVVGVVALMAATATVPWIRNQPPFQVMLWTTLVGSILGITTYHFLWTPKMRLEVFASTTAAKYPPGTRIAGIEWSEKYAEVRLVLVNSSKKAFEDMDLVVKLDRPIAAIAPTEPFDGVRFEPNSAPTINMESINSATGERTAIPLVLVATDAGFRIHCAKLPSKSRLELILAAVEMVKPMQPASGSGIMEPDYWLRSGAGEGTASWFGHSGHAGRVFAKRPIVTRAEVKGQFRAQGGLNDISVSVTVADLIGDAAKRILKQPMQNPKGAP